MRTTVRISLTDSPDKLAYLPVKESPVSMGMHDELAAFYGSPDASPHASTLDYVVAALGACLAGTFKRTLTTRGVTVEPSQLEVEAIGRIVVDGDVPVIAAVEVRYRMRQARPEDRVKIERAHNVHHRGCAVSRSLEGAFDISTSLEIVGAGGA